MLMNLEEQIYLRKSCRKYCDGEIDMNMIHDFLKGAKPLNSDINYHYEILMPDEVSIRNRWRAPYYLALYSEKKDNYGENLGFVFQQLCLYLQANGIGNCWVGLDVPKKKNTDFVISIAFGKSQVMTRKRDEFKRKSLSKISDFEDEKLIPAQLAPSAINSQPWYFRHNEDDFDVFCLKQNLLKRKILGKWNSVDVGIVLAHMYVANENTFEFYKKRDFESLKGYNYVGSIKI